MYGLQQRMNTKMMTKVILTVFTLALGMRPRELARRLSDSAAADAADAEVGLAGKLRKKKKAKKHDFFPDQ